MASNQEVVTTGVNKATRQYKQVPVGRALFDDTKVSPILPAVAMLLASVVQDLAGDCQSASLTEELGMQGALLVTNLSSSEALPDIHEQTRTSYYLALGAAGAVLRCTANALCCWKF